LKKDYATVTVGRAGSTTEAIKQVRNRLLVWANVDLTWGFDHWQVILLVKNEDYKWGMLKRELQGLKETDRVLGT
jgi:hypothetical protein